MSTIHLLIRELEESTRPVTEGRRVVGWPRVSHPALVRRWLGDSAVEDDGTLADPEAAGHVLVAARATLAGIQTHDVDTTDLVVRHYLDAYEAMLAREEVEP